MSRRRIRSLVIVLVAALIVTMMPLTASAASKKPGKVKITSFKVGAVSTATNKTTVTIKWKKASKATKYEIYEQGYDGTWHKLKTVKKSVRKLKITNVPAGQYNIKIRAVNKKTKGKFSAVKGKFIISPLTLEQYVNRVEPSLKYSKVGPYSLSFTGNTVIFTYEAAPDYPEMTTEQAKANTEFHTWLMDNYINKNLTLIRAYVAKLPAGTGIRNLRTIVRCTFNGTELVYKSF